MGHCFSRAEAAKRRPPKRTASRPPPAGGGRNPSYRNRSLSRKRDVVFQEHELAAAILFHQKLQNGDGSGYDAGSDRAALALSHRLSKSKRSHQTFPRSSSSTARSLDPLLPPHQLSNEQDVNIDDLETNHFVLVHGGGFGAWCWYKTISLLQEAGFRATALDLTGSGIHSFDTNSVTSMSQYVKPLTDFLEQLADGEKVILVGHDFGGACISYAMELFSSKVSRAVFIAAAMLSSGQSTLDMFSQNTNSNDLMRQAQIFIYANCNNNSPTAINLDKSLLKDLLFNQSPAKDIALASVSMRPIPFSPILEKLTLSDDKYGSIKRFYVETPEDNAIPIALQHSMIDQNPPQKVYHLKGADHSPFFSKPQSLHKILLEIARIPSKPS
nr:putative methylesterase 11, chloroplastic [Ipomoea batatas]